MFDIITRRLPPNAILGTDDQGRIIVFERPQMSFTRVAVASLLSRFPGGSQGGSGTGDWDVRLFTFPISTKPQGIAEDWITTPGGVSFRLNNPGQYLIQVAAIANKVDAHQIRLRGLGTGAIFEGLSIQTIQPSVNRTLKNNFETISLLVSALRGRLNNNVDSFEGLSLVTTSMLTASFTLGTTSTEPTLPQDFVVEHKLKLVQRGRNNPSA